MTKEQAGTETIPRCCEFWPQCTHTLALFERSRMGCKLSDADMRRLHATEAEFQRMNSKSEQAGGSEQ